MTQEQKLHNTQPFSKIKLHNFQLEVSDMPLYRKRNNLNQQCNKNNDINSLTINEN